MKLLLALILLPTIALSELKQRQLDLKELRDPATRIFAAQKLLHNGKLVLPEPSPAQSQTFQNLSRLFKCPQRDGKPPLTAFLYQSFDDNWPLHELDNDDNLSASRRQSKIKDLLLKNGSYPPETNPNLTVEIIADARPNADGYNSPNATRMQKWVLAFFDQNGQEQWIFGGNNMISGGFLFDINNDGILEQIDTTNWGVHDDYSVKTLHIKTVELEPKTLLNVLYEWHHDDYEESRSWSFDCRDLNNDNLPEIIFGPKNPDGTIDPTATFHWNTQKQKFNNPSEPDTHLHLLRLKNKEAWKQLNKLTNPLKYALKPPAPIKPASSSPTSAPETSTPNSSSPLPFNPVDSSTLTDTNLWKFMGKGRNHYDVKRETNPPNMLPENFWNLPAKEAALQLVDKNRSKEHRQTHQLFFSKDSTAPPKSGWLVSRYISDKSYTSINELFAISFGVPAPQLLVINSSSHGIVGSSPLSDQTGYELRNLSITAPLARHLADTIWWLDQLRSHATEEEGFSHISSSADGRGSIYFLGEHKRILADANHWAGYPISQRWSAEYDREVMLNFSSWLINTQLPIHLSNLEQWPLSSLKHQNLATSKKEKLKPRHNSGARHHLVASTRQLLTKHQQTPIPPEFISWLFEMTGEVGLLKLLPDLQKFQEHIPQPNTSEKRLTELEENFAPQEKAVAHDWNAQNALYDLPDYCELVRLRNLKPLLPTASLRGPLKRSLDRLHLLKNQDQLAKKALENTYQGLWALKQLPQYHPKAYHALLAERFHSAPDLQQRRQALHTLANHDPETVIHLAQSFTPLEWQELALPIAKPVQDHAPELLPQLLTALLALADSPDEGWNQRNQALSLLIPFKNPLHFPDTRIDELLARLAIDPKNEKDEIMPQVIPTAVTTAILLRNRHPDSWSILQRQLDEKSTISFDPYLDLLALHASRSPKNRKQALNYLQERIPKNYGRLETVFEVALALDLRSLTPLIEPLATTNSSSVESEEVNHATSHQEPKPNDRFHRGRHLLQIWHQKDPQQYFRTLTAFALQHPRLFHEDFNSTHWALNHKLLLASYESCPPEQRQSFLEFCHTQIQPNSQAAALLEKLTKKPKDPYLPKK